jgi:hypothetical protein
MIERESQIKELFDLKHRKDNEINTGFDYENKLLDKIMPAYARKNEMINDFVLKLQNLFVWGIETQLTIRNFYNYTVSRYYNKHPN